MKKIPIGLQLFSVRDRLQLDYAGTLAAVAAMGFDGIEFFDGFPLTARETKAILADNGITPVSTHVLLPDLEAGAARRTADFQAELGVQNVILATLPEGKRESRADWESAADLLNEREELFRNHGIRLGYHNHRMEFEPIDGEIPFHILFKRLHPSVIMQIDAGHALRAGADPCELLRAYPGRSRLVHARDWSKHDEKALLGDGDVPWEEFLSLCETTGGTEWLIVEQGDARIPSLEAAAACLEFLRTQREKGTHDAI